MRIVFLLLTLLGLALAGCGDDVTNNGSSSGETTLAVVSAFSFSPAALTDAAPESMQSSSQVNIDMTGSMALISVVNGEYSIDGGPFTSSTGTVTSGNKVMVRHRAASGYNQTVTTTLTIGDKSATFSSTTASLTSIGLNFSGPSLLLNVPPSSIQISNVIAVSIMGVDVPISVAGGEYSINGAPYTTLPGIVNNGDRVTLRHISANGTTETTVTTTLTVADLKTTFTTSTASVATQKIVLSGSAGTLHTAQAAILYQGSHSVRVVEGGGKFSFDNETFFDITSGPRTASLWPGRVLYLAEVPPFAGHWFETVIEVGELQRIILKVKAL